MVLEGIKKASPPPTLGTGGRAPSLVIAPGEDRDVGQSLPFNPPFTLGAPGTVPQGEDEPKILLGRVGPGGEVLALITRSHNS